jgi:hypothetical protein
MTSKKFLGAGVVAIAMMLGTAGAANAGKPGLVEEPTCPPPDTTDCDTELEDLCYTIDNSGEPLKERTIDSWVSKVVGAALKLNEDKPDHAVDKLDQIEASVNDVAGAPKEKINEADADAIIADVILARSCIEAQ